MSGSREVKLTIVPGVKGVGKSYGTFFRFLLPTAMGLLNGDIPRKVLIIDPNDEYGKMEPHPSDKLAMELTGGKTVYIKAIEPKDIRAFSTQTKIEIRRLRPFHYRNYYDEKGKLKHKAGDMMGEEELLRLVVIVLTQFRDSCILIEDLSSTVGSHVPDKIFKEITRNRHRGNDIITHVQSVNVILPKFWDNIDITRFHKQNVDVERSEEKLLDRYPLYKIAQLMINEEYNSGNIRYMLYIDNMKHKIMGDYTEKEMMDAIYQYIDLSSNILRVLLNQRTDGGHKLRTYSQAREEKAQELFKKYYTD